MVGRTKVRSYNPTLNTSLLCFENYEIRQRNREHSPRFIPRIAVAMPAESLPLRGRRGITRKPLCGAIGFAQCNFAAVGAPTLKIRLHKLVRLALLECFMTMGTCLLTSTTLGEA